MNVKRVYFSLSIPYFATLRNEISSEKLMYDLKASFIPCDAYLSKSKRDKAIGREVSLKVTLFCVVLMAYFDPSINSPIESTWVVLSFSMRT